MRISDWSSDVCSSDLGFSGVGEFGQTTLSPLQIRHSAARRTPDLHFYESASPSVGALVADPRVNVLLRPSNCVAAELDRLGKFPFGHPAIDRRPAQPDTVLDFLDADEARHAFRLCCRRSEEHTSALQSLMRTSYAVICL